MLDRFSKKFLRHLNSAKSPDSTMYDFLELEELSQPLCCTPNEIKLNAEYLKDLGYIKYIPNQHGKPAAFMLSHKGLHWKEFRRQEILKYLKDKWIDFFSLVVSFIAVTLSLIALLTK